MKHGSWVVPAIAAAFLLATGLDALAAARDWEGALTGRLLRIKETRTVRLGFREGAVPFSWLGPDGKPVGYSLDICERIVATIGSDLGIPDLGIEYVRVSVQDRIDRVVTGAVDLECGATTNTAERRKRVAFSPAIFVSGTRLAAPRTSSIRDWRDVAGRKVVVVRGTTNEVAVREFDRLRRLGMTIEVAERYTDALALLESGGVDMLAADDVLLHAYLAESGKHRTIRTVGEMLSFEPYGIMYRRDDPVLGDVVERTLRALAQSREIVWIYNRWFMRPLPSGRQLNLPMGPQLSGSLELLGLPPD
jgi:glutamate/aspartate transport system substrate-binding protein